MAARKPAGENPPETVRPQEYAAGEGWEVGKTAPSDAFRALDDKGFSVPVGPVVYEHPGGHARQIAAKGGLVTEGVKRELDAAGDEEKATSADSTSDESDES